MLYLKKNLSLYSGSKLMKDSVVIGGTGMVGHATMFALGIEHYYAKSTANVELKNITDYKYIFICLPTPTNGGKQDIKIIEHYLKLIKENYKNNVVIIRSTVLPGTCVKWIDTYKIKIVHVPEFLTESSWMDDSKWPDIIVVGAEHDSLREEVAGIFKSRYKGSEYFLTDTITSETIKYGINCLYALKVVYANQLYDYCMGVGANYNTIMKAMYARKWIGKNHLDVWHNKERGAGGKCLEKDLTAFASESDLLLLKIAEMLNQKYLHGDTETIKTVR